MKVVGHSLAAPRNSPYFIGVVQGPTGGIDSVHWQVQIRAPGGEGMAVGLSPRDGKEAWWLPGERIIGEWVYPMVNAEEDGVKVLDANLMYGARITAEQYAKAEALFEAHYTDDESVGIWQPFTNSCRMAAVRVYSRVLDEIGAWSPEAVTLRHDWTDIAWRGIKYEIDAGDYFTWVPVAAIIGLFGFTPSALGGTPERPKD